jgi:hypothetical protein
VFNQLLNQLTGKVKIGNETVGKIVSFHLDKRVELNELDNAVEQLVDFEDEPESIDLSFLRREIKPIKIHNPDSSYIKFLSDVLNKIVTKNVFSQKLAFKKMVNELEKQGFMAGYDGSSRWTFFNDKEDLVIKVSSSVYDGINQTRNEVELAKVLLGELPDKYVEVRDIFVLPYAMDTKNFRWIIVPKARVNGCDLTEKEVSEIESFLTVRCKNLKVDYTDMHSDNVGVIGSKPVIIDYG